MQNPPQTTAQLIAQIESDNNQYAMRYEPDVSISKASQSAIKKHNPFSDVTCVIIGKTSWGLYQIMGYNIYKRGYAKQIGEYLNDPQAQLFMFNRFLDENDINFSIEYLKESKTAREKFAKVYNGSVYYARKIEVLL